MSRGVFLGGGGQPGVELGKPSATHTASGQGKPESRGEGEWVAGEGGRQESRGSKANRWAAKQ